MTVTRHFLGWDSSVTDKVVDFMLSDKIDAPPDLARDIIVVPTRQAGRRLREALALRCAAAETAVLSARVETPALFARGEGGTACIATPMQVAAAWAAVLMEMGPSDFPGLFPVRPPERDFGWTLNTADMLQDLREALADGGLMIGDVTAKFAALIEESDRWRDLAALEARYLRRLATTGLDDPCSHKIAYVLAPEVPEGVERIVVAAVPDPSALMTVALERLQDRVEIVVLVHAPAELADRFDGFGRPDTLLWKKATLDIPGRADSILLAASPSAQSEQVLGLVARHASSLGPADLAVGVPDRAVVPFLSAALEAKGLGSFDPSGRSPAEHPVFRLIAAIRALVTSGDYESVAVLLRHPDMLAFLRARHGVAPSGLMRELDEFQNRHLPSRYEDFEEHLQPDTNPALHRAIACIGQFRDRLADKGGLCGALREVLRSIYEKRDICHGNPEDEEFMAVAKLVDDAVHELGEMIAGGNELSVACALDLLLRRLTKQVYYSERDDALVDLEGWLELPWNNAPLLIVTGMNDGIVPESRLSDPFLPDSLRVALGLRNDDSRFARDIYLMASLLECRRGHGRVYLVVGKTAQNGEPLKPSRLLFRCSDGELRERAELLFGEAPQLRESQPSTISFRLRPEVPDEAGLTRLSVTAFRAYLACPFRFYLQHVLKMDELDDSKTELDAMDFGNLVHNALQQMSRDGSAGRSDDEVRVADFLCEQADKWVRGRFGRQPPLQVLIQLDAAKQRLGRAAREHTALVREGWETVASESRYETEFSGMTISGIIDRVDRHKRSGNVRIIDYKTSDSGSAPVKTHLAWPGDDTPEFARVTVDGKAMCWTDLQLPLYRLLLAGAMDLPAGVQLGYFNLPKAISETGLSLWGEFPDVLRESAEACADGVISAVRAGRFWPPAGKVAFDQFERIVFGDVEAAVEWGSNGEG